MKINRFMIAAPKSGSGKTMITCALLQLLKDSGKNVLSYKCGPDYIDPMFHKKVLGVSSKNLDTFFTDEKTTVQLFLDERADGDFAVLEGVMGLYDGLGGIYEQGSSYHLAKVTQTPIILVVDAKGMGKSVLALIAGFLQYDTHHLIKGVLLNRMSKGYYDIIKPLIEKVMSILDENIKDTGSVMIGGEEKYDRLEKSFTELLSFKITDAIKRMDIPGTIKSEGKAMLHEHAASSSLLALVMSDKLIDRIMTAVSEKMEEFIDTRGPEMVSEITTSRIHDLGERTPLHVLEQAGYDADFVREKITSAYRESVVNAVNSALRRIDVAKVVEDKINSMAVEELEKGVLTVMKTELNMIVNLGALIGLVIGSLNIFI